MDAKYPLYHVYRNLRRSCWSIRNARTLLVVGHATQIRMEDVCPIVSEAGRQRVIAEGRKNVHAYLMGRITDIHRFSGFSGRSVVLPDPIAHWSDDFECDSMITYNPYIHTGFIDPLNNNRIVKYLKNCYLSTCKVFANCVEYAD